AAAESFGAAHRGVDPVGARDVVRRRDDAAAVRVAADDQRLRAEARVLELLDGCEERVEIEVRDDHAARVRAEAADVCLQTFMRSRSPWDRRCVSNNHKALTQDLQPLPETLELIYEHARGGPARQSITGDAIDAKAFQI